ncbi:epiphycan-like [Entelurus aequoreus]|uniref:epiphycan-like n=1 Tax=Entelurus aequoreus TaxID=161455 RepID=UPI002B1D3195|nr:epiphycan-like [Entelurus aequoreus]XP_061901128.1 epiphycan-like [Entelurus aequoreus]XP_061901136.1 epiphycan-like [Entelurus aequoreus]
MKKGTTATEVWKSTNPSRPFYRNKPVTPMFELRASLPSLMMAVALALLVSGPCPGFTSPLHDPHDDDGFDLENYDLNTVTDLETLGANVYEDNYDYEDLDQEIEVGTVANIHHPDSQTKVEHHQEKVVTIKEPLPPTLDFKGSGFFGPQTGLGMPTCLLCVCISGSVYCDDIGLEQIPPMPKETTHFYGRFNKIRHVKNTDFTSLSKLQSIDLTGNQISEMDEDVFRSLKHLQHLLLADNNLQVLPELPATMKRIDLRNNRLISRGLHSETFKDMSQLQFLYLSYNNLDYIPTPLPLSLRVLHLQGNNIQSLHEDTFCDSHDRSFIRRKLEDIRLDGNPLNIHQFPRAYVCLPRLPVGGQ